MKNKLTRKILSLILATITFLSVFTIPSSAFSLKVGDNPYIIFSQWHLCILKNYAEADRIRDELKARGIEIIDTPQGAKWRKV